MMIIDDICIYMFAVHVQRSSYVSPGSLHPSCIRTTKCDELHPSGLLTVSPGITLRLLWHQAAPMGALRPKHAENRSGLIWADMIEGAGFMTNQIWQRKAHEW